LTITKSKNSILVLTTLGVYLSLLMVGGSAPQVFAHSATTRNFEITDEIEVKDDLDTKPDDTIAAAEIVNSASFREFASAYAEYVLDSYNDELRFGEKLNRACPDGCRLSNLTYFTTFTPTLEQFFSVSDYTQSIDWKGDTRHQRIEIKYSPSHGELSGLQSAFLINSTGSERPFESIIQSSNVQIEPQNGHLVIVTRLPRAGLDALLAKDAK